MSFSKVELETRPHRERCPICEKVRVCEGCISCGETVCRQPSCSRFVEGASTSPMYPPGYICNPCYDESREYAKGRMWGGE